MGPEQSGHIHAVGLEFYLEMLEEAVSELKSGGTKPGKEEKDPEIKVPIPAFIPKKFVQDDAQRLTLYRRLSRASTPEELKELRIEILERFGPLPDPLQNLFEIIRIKQILKKHGVDSLTVGMDKFTFQAQGQSRIQPELVFKKVKESGGKIVLAPDSKLIIERPFHLIQSFSADLESLLEELSSGTL